MAVAPFRRWTYDVAASVRRLTLLVAIALMLCAGRASAQGIVDIGAMVVDGNERTRDDDLR